MKRKAKIEFKKSKAGAQKGKWRCTVKGGNGEILHTSEGYTSRLDAQRGLDDLVNVLCSHLKERHENKTGN